MPELNLGKRPLVPVVQIREVMHAVFDFISTNYVVKCYIIRLTKIRFTALCA